MKKSLLLMLLISAVLVARGQDVVGAWNGLLSVQGTQLRLVLNVEKTDVGYSSTLDSPDQGAKGIPVSSTSFADSILKFQVANLRIEYEGKYNGSNIVGTFKQNGMSFPMNLSREKIEKKSVVRPQEPVKPYPYYSEEVTFENTKDKITLAGTLTLPRQEGNFPAVILISGSGPQNRDEELMGHKPFLVLADYLTKNGIAVLRFDDRGTAQSQGIFKTATSADFAVDAGAAVSYLLSRKEINKKKIGLIGHSEGGIVAPMVASQVKQVSFIVLMAGTGIPGDQLLLLQQELIARASGANEADIQKSKSINRGAYDIMKKAADADISKNELTSYFKQTVKDLNPAQRPANMSDDDLVSLQVNQLSSPWMYYFIKYDPAATLKNVKCPVLAINGEKDLQVPPKINLSAIRENLIKGGNKNVTIKELPNLNHLFQECETGSPIEYAKIEQTFSPTALAEITNWIQKQVK